MTEAQIFLLSIFFIGASPLIFFYQVRNYRFYKKLIKGQELDKRKNENY